MTLCWWSPTTLLTSQKWLLLSGFPGLFHTLIGPMASPAPLVSLGLQRHKFPSSDVLKSSPPIFTASGQHSSSVVPHCVLSKQFQPHHHLSQQQQQTSLFKPYRQPFPSNSRILHSSGAPLWSVRQHLHQIGSALVPPPPCTQVCPLPAWSCCPRPLVLQTFLLLSIT